MTSSTLSYIFPIFSYLLMIGLAYGSQLLFSRIEPYGLTSGESLHFNLVVIFALVGYTRSWLTDPGHIPSGWQPKDEGPRSRWCRKCEAPKPPRAHHCKTCGRCIPKMDHHCPWTVNCVSHRTLPHFLRFLIYGIWALGLLEKYLFERLAILWNQRHLPSYLGPSFQLMASLFVLVLISTITLFAVGVLLIRSVWSLFTNVTSIESWEIERHSTLIHRAKTFGGYLDGPNGERIPIRKQEFPYDIGFWSNFKQVFGSNPLAWLWPFAFTPSSESGMVFATNGFEDDSVIWPPPDPDRMPRTRMKLEKQESEIIRRASDPRRVSGTGGHSVASTGGSSGDGGSQRRRRFHERYTADGMLGGSLDLPTHLPAGEDDDDGEESWQNAEGERLADFGLDEEAEFYDEKEN